MTRFIVPILLLLALAFAIAGSADERYPERPTDDRGVLLAIAQAPHKTRAWRNPYEGQPGAVLAGKSSSSSIAPSVTDRTPAGEAAP